MGREGAVRVALRSGQRLGGRDGTMGVWIEPIWPAGAESGAQKVSDPTCLRHVGPPWEGDIGLFCKGSADLGRHVAQYFSMMRTFFRFDR